FLTLEGAKCQAPIEWCRPSCSRNVSNLTPPDLVHAPAPSTALNVSGSQASNIETTCCDGAFASACAGPATTAAGAVSTVEGLTGCDRLSHPTITAAAATRG